jgi:putative transposase
MAPSTYYDTKERIRSARACRDAERGPALVALWEDNYRVYGVCKLWKAPPVAPATTLDATGPS